jgi:hypothetical protein
MKTRSVLLIVVLLLGGIVGSVIEVSASSPATVSELQETWFVVGYFFDVAKTAEHIIILRLLLISETTPEVLAKIQQWESGTLTKEEVRAVLLNYLRTQGDLCSFESFRMGEWVSNIQDSVIDLKHGVENDNNRLVFEATVTAHALACQARGFIDVFADTAPQEVLQALEQIADKGSKIDIAGLIIGDADTRETVTALVDLLDLCKSIKRGYGLGD